MARIKDTVCVLRGLGRVAVAYSSEVCRELSEIVNIVPTAFQNQFDNENGRGHGMPDDFPGWENFSTGEFGIGAEYSSSLEPPSLHPPPDPRQPPTTTHMNTTNTSYGGGRSFHTLSHLRSLQHLQTPKRRCIVEVDAPSRKMTSGETVMGPGPTASQEAGQESDKTHLEQQQKVERVEHIIRVTNEHLCSSSHSQLHTLSSPFLSPLPHPHPLPSTSQLRKKARERVVPASRLGRMASFGGNDPQLM